MEKIDLNIIKEHISTKYGDMTGAIQIDGHDNISSIYQLCEDLGIEIEAKFIIGFGLSDSGILGIGQHGAVHCRVLYFDENEYGTTYEEVQRNIMNREKNVKVKQIMFTAPYSVIGKYIKRFDLLVTSDLLSDIENFEIEEN